ncbi:MAG TPA: thiamine phosphate synthase [Methanocorpusculum sp.]|nr:thiamine phosphate synthase [Methanocorpusculum sp.]
MIRGLYVVTDEVLSHGKSHAEIAAEAVSGGASIIQLRDKSASSLKLYSNAVKIAEICRGKAVFIVNDRIDAALASGADGVHLGQGDIPADIARKLCGKDFIIGVSVGSLAEAEKAVADGADYIAVSPVYATASKADAGAGHGLSLVREIRKAFPAVPLVGIGGLNRENAAEAVSAGLDSVAVVSAVVSAADIKSAARELSLIISEAKHD